MIHVVAAIRQIGNAHQHRRAIEEAAQHGFLFAQLGLHFLALGDFALQVFICQTQCRGALDDALFERSVERLNFSGGRAPHFMHARKFRCPLAKVLQRPRTGCAFQKHDIGKPERRE